MFIESEFRDFKSDCPHLIDQLELEEVRDHCWKPVVS